MTAGASFLTAMTKIRRIDDENKHKKSKTYSNHISQKLNNNDSFQCVGEVLSSYYAGETFTHNVLTGGVVMGHTFMQGNFLSIKIKGFGANW